MKPRYNSFAFVVAFAFAVGVILFIVVGSPMDGQQSDTTTPVTRDGTGND